MTKVVRVSPDNPDAHVLIECARVIKAGGLVAFPTETVYGLGADAFNEEAVRRVFKVKGRPPNNPLIVHIASLNQLGEVALSIPERAWKLIRWSWPGPLTLVLKRKEDLPQEVTAGLDTVAVRMPANPIALKLIELSRTALVAPSANLSGKPSPTTAEHVIQDLYGKVDVIIDGGETIYGLESTIIDITAEPPEILRPGAIPPEAIERVLNVEVRVRPLVKSPVTGRMRRYAPRTPIIVVEARDYSDLRSYVRRVKEVVKKNVSKRLRVAVIASLETCQHYGDLGVGVKVLSLGSRRDLFSVGRKLFKVLRDVDRLNVDIAIVEGFEEKGLGISVMDRLRKASCYNVVKF
ncbi:MAG: threonylcarbamoyl-AMP synthase [Desulfurococcales archaeon ex4484_204]|nr:MAG: threonylcarbamoyl-AMP synthase [Desulfurococcales archaeon ex4484_204]